MSQPSAAEPPQSAPKDAVSPGSVLRCLADELQRQHQDALALQDSLSRVLVQERLPAASITCMQRLDSLTQTLHDLTRVLDVLAAHPNAAPAIQDILEVVTLGGLRTRLSTPCAASGATGPQTGSAQPAPDPRETGRDTDVSWL